MKQYHNNLYDPTQKEVYKILGSYGIDKPRSSMVIELCNLVIDHVEGAYESGFTHANNDWAFKVDATLAKKLGVKQEPRYTATECKNLVLNTIQKGIDIKRPIDNWYWLAIASAIDKVN